MRFELLRYTPAGVIGATEAPATRKILWWGLREDVRLYPEIEVLRGLAELEMRLRALAESPGLTRIAGEAD